MKVCTNEGKCHCQDGFDPKDSCSSGERNVSFFYLQRNFPVV